MIWVKSVVVVLAAYAFWATGLRPFTAPAYLAVGIPVLVLACGAVVDDRRVPPTPRVTLRSVWMWLALLTVALGLEVVALALGGRSASVPTLSTVIDYALTRHVVRFVLFCGWLALGAAPIVRIVRRGGAGDPQ